VFKGLIDNPQSQFHSWQWHRHFLKFFWVFTQWNDQLHQAITLKVIWTKPKCLKMKTSPFSTTQSMDCRIFLPLEKLRVHIMIKLWMCQLSCCIVWTSRKVNVTSATTGDGEDSGHLHPFKILGSINPVSGPRRPQSSRSRLWKPKTLQEKCKWKN